jgi:hypothetical protein
METGYAMSAKAVQVEQIKRKKPGFIKRWFAKMSREVWEDSRQENNLVQQDDIISMKQTRLGLISAGPTNIDQPERAIQFTIYNANGGRVVETRRYDRQKDRHSNGLYVITSDQDFGREIDKIITMEALK